MQKTLMEMLIEAGYPKEEMDHHDSDLYVYVTPLTTKVIEEWCKAHDYRMVWHYSLTQEQYKTAKEMYDKCRCIEDILIDVIRLLYPEDTFETGTIRGYSQGDWQDYIVKGDVDTDLLEAMYFGKISDITVTTGEEEFGDVITHDELWRAEREEGLKEFFRNHYELDKDEEIHILQADGYKQVVDWKAVG